MPKINTSRALAKIADDIRALDKKNLQNEKDTIKNIIEIGRRLHDASEIPDTHGEFMAWTEREFPQWSHQTLLNYRNVYELVEGSAEIQNCLEFGSVNLSIGALYMVAALKNEEDQRESRDAILNEAMEKRVTRSRAKAIIEEHKPRLEPDPPPVEPEPVEPEEALPREATLSLEDDDEADEHKEPESEAQERLREIIRRGVEKGRNKIADTQDDDADAVEDEAPHEAKVVCADCGKNAEQAKATGHTLLNEAECNGLGSACGVWRCTSCSQDEELKAKRKAIRNNGLAAHYAKQFAKVANFVKLVTEVGVWPEVIEQMGEERFRALVAQLQAALDGGTTDTVKAKADRAETKASRKMH